MYASPVDLLMINPGDLRVKIRGSKEIEEDGYQYRKDRNGDADDRCEAGALAVFFADFRFFSCRFIMMRWNSKIF